MRIFRATQDDAPRGASAALGNFDGVHLGHRAVIAAASEAAPGSPLAVTTFEPHPRRFFAPESPSFELMNFDAKARALAALGVELLFVLDFDQELATMAPDAFCRDVLSGRLGLSHVAVGEDFRFGAKRAGDAAMLRRQGAGLGFGVTTVARDIEASSTAIRELLDHGDPAAAARMIGDWHRVEGPVIHGARRGREMGWPTANLSLDRVVTPRHGVYAVLVDVLDGPRRGRYEGVASIGVRPMFGENAPNLEVHLFDFSGDLYGAEISVALVAFLRPEKKFESVQTLIARMERDGVEARAALAGAKGP